MAANKLNPSAPPFHCPYALHHLGSLSPPMPPYHAGASPPPSPVGAIFLCAQFSVPSPHHHQFIQFPVLHPSQILCKTGHSLPARFLRKGFPGKPAKAFRKGVPAKPPRAFRKLVPVEPTEVICKDVPALPEDVLPKDVDVAEPAPHGLPPHKLMVAGTVKKLQAVAMAEVAVECGQEEPAPAARDRQVRVARRKAEKRQNKGGRDGAKSRAATPPFAFTTARRAPSSKFTTPSQLPPSKIPNLGSRTTVMVRNIPNRLKGDEMIALLDEHCARTNRAAGAVVSAYDVVYLPMDFRTGGNYGYAFVNFTTAEAAQRLCNSLHGCRWKVFGSGKTIHIFPAKIQGREALEHHFSRHRFECQTEEYLPAVFTPARDGGVRATETTTKRVGKLEVPRPGAAPVPPRHVKKKKLYAVRAKVQG